MNKAEITDAELINKVLQGRTEKFALLVERYEKLVFSFLLGRSSSSQEVEDAVQETFIKAYSHLAAFDCERKFSAWLLAIAKNVMIDMSRKNSRDVPSDDIVIDVLLNDSSKDLSDQTAEELFKRERFKQITLMIRSLPEELKTPFILRIVNEMSYQDIAEALDVPLQTVKNRIFKARSILREKSEKSNEI